MPPDIFCLGCAVVGSLLMSFDEKRCKAILLQDSGYESNLRSDQTSITMLAPINAAFIDPVLQVGGSPQSQHAIFTLQISFASSGVTG